MSVSAPYDSRVVANFLLKLASERGLTLTQLTLYKIVYFSHGWYLTLFSHPLISHEFEAWPYGPVIHVLREQFESYGDEPITKMAERLDIFTGSRSIVAPIVSGEDARFITHIFDSYHHYTAWKLSEMTHEPNSPWDRLWNSAEPVGRLALRIKNEEIKAYFDRLPTRLNIS
jgi:uncharacterized phage-associated protein